MKCAPKIAPGPWRAIAAFTALIPLSACRDATQARITLRTDALCADVSETSISTAAPQRVDDAEPVAVTSACGAQGRIGDLVIVPSGAKDEPFEVRVVTGLNKSADDCVRDNYVGGCIVARRSLRFLPHRSLQLPILLEVACKDVPCNATQTCRHGQCVSALVDPDQCASADGCDVADPVSNGAAGAATGGSAGALGSGGAPSAAGEGGALEAGASDGGAADGGASDAGAGGTLENVAGAQAVTLTSSNTTPDALPSDALNTFFQSAPVDANSFLYLGVVAPAPHGFEYCLERADWYAQRYIANADGELDEQSGAWQKWWRSPGGSWSAPDRTPHANYFGQACEPSGRSFCLEWMLGGQLMSIQPAWTNSSEFFSNGYSDDGTIWNVQLRVGPTRLTTCGF